MGFARIISDYATTFYLADVIIDPEYQHQGLVCHPNHSLTNLCQIVVRCKAEEGVDASASTTDDNAADGDKMVQISKEMIGMVH